jgi:hypothetical protein
MQTKYPLKIQAIRSKNQQARLYVYFPLPLAAAIGLEAGEEVQWELLDRGELHTWSETNCRKSKLLKGPPSPPKSRCRPKNRLLKADGAGYLTEVTHDRPVSEN